MYRKSQNTTYENLYGAQKKIKDKIEEGEETYSNGEIYIGTFKNGERHGFGKYTFSDGKKYEGFFKNGLKHGHGKIIHKNGKIIYVEYKDNKLVTNLYGDHRDWDLDDWRSNNTHFHGLAPTMIKSNINGNVVQQRKNHNYLAQNTARQKPVSPKIMSQKDRDFDQFINRQKDMDYFRTNHPSQQRSTVYNPSSVYGDVIIQNGAQTTRRYQNSYISRSIDRNSDTYRSNFYYDDY